MVILRVNAKVVGAVKVLTYFLLLFSVVTKLFCIPYISHKFASLGIAAFCHVFGVIELVAICFFFYEKTMGLGLMLLCCYFGGAIATDIHAPQYLYQPVTVVVFVVLTAFVRKPAIFLNGLEMRSENRLKTIIFTNA